MSEPRNVTIAAVEEELAAAHAHAARHGWRLTWLSDDLVVQADGTYPADKSTMRWRADVADYRALPPIWTCWQLDDKGTPKARFPNGGPLPGGGASIFHGSGVICAPFNRLAFKTPTYVGPHENWGDPANWLQIRGNVRAACLGDMLALIIAHLTYSTGWLK